MVRGTNAIGLLMSTAESPVRLDGGKQNGYGATHWRLELSTRTDGRGLGGVLLQVDIHTQTEGLCIAGNYISWEDLRKAEEYAKRARDEFQKRFGNSAS